MTTGTSQGLFVIIAVVIFGIFVAISYLLFQDTLNPKLMNIFDTSLENAEKSLRLKPSKYLENFNKDFSGNIDSEIIYNVKNIEQDAYANIYAFFGGNKKLLVPVGTKFRMSFTIRSEKDIILYVDYNSRLLSDKTERPPFNDYYSNAITEKNSTYYKVVIPKDKDVNLTLGYDNIGHVKNPDKEAVNDFTSIGLHKSENNPTNFKVFVKDVVLTTSKI